MSLVVNGLVSLMLGLAVWRFLPVASRLRDTTLVDAWRWGGLALTGWGIAWGTFVVTPDAPPLWLESAWYFAAVAGLCPWVAVLGAKRPGVRVWSLFVLLPLIAVLTLPVLARGWAPAGDGQAELRVPLPLMLGYALVLLMGTGNYVGTRYGLPAALAGLALCLIAAPLSDAAPGWLAGAETLRIWGTAALAMAILWASRESLRATVARSPIERLWFDYRDVFGIAWARRLLERVNDRAETEGWAWRLSDDGFLPVDATIAPAPVEADPRIEHTFRWLLRRFVDPGWIDQRLASAPGEPDAQP